MKEEIVTLTGLRGLAALWVCAYHALSFVDPATQSWVAGAAAVLGSGGYLGVDIFFVLSGFVLAHNYGAAAARPSTYGPYLWKRLARIYPVHLATLAFLSISIFALGLRGIEYVHPEFLTLDGLARSLVLVHAWQFPITPTWNAASWSISAEWAAYLAFPLVALGAARIRSPAVALAVILLLYAALYSFISASGLPRSVAFAMPRIAAGFSAGVLLYRIWQVRGCSRSTAGDVMASIALALMVLGSGVLDASMGDGWSIRGFPILACAIVYGLASSSRWAARMTSAGVLQYLGRISYSLYMIHTIVIYTALSIVGGRPGSGAEAATLIAISIATSLVLAALCYRYVEEPCRRVMVMAGGSQVRWSGHSAPAR
jgi:peptidoglycan/LPS O-acetylase OafA/YrhL